MSELADPVYIYQYDLLKSFLLLAPSSLPAYGQRGNVNDIMAAPGRVFVVFWLVFTMVVGIMYSSSLTSFLITPGMQKPIENLRQLVSSDIGWGKVSPVAWVLLEG